MDKVLSPLLKRGVVPYAIAAVVVLTGLTGVAAATDTLGGGTTATPTASAATAASAEGQLLPGYPAAGGGNNIVQVINRTDTKFKIDGKSKLNQINGPNVGPKNEAVAFSSCTDCQTIAVALEINLVNPASHNVQPFNNAVALNYKCTDCRTFAFAYQYVIPVNDPSQVPPDVKALVSRMDDKINDLKNSNVTLDEALGQVVSVINSFQELAAYLDSKQDQSTDTTTPGASPLPSDSSSPGSATASPSATVSGSPVESATPTSSP